MNSVTITPSFKRGLAKPWPTMAAGAMAYVPGVVAGEGEEVEEVEQGRLFEK